METDIIDNRIVYYRKAVNIKIKEVNNLTGLPQEYKVTEKPIIIMLIIL